MPFNADFISFMLERPVEIITGFFVLAISLIKFKSVISNEEILYTLGLNFFRN